MRTKPKEMRRPDGERRYSRRMRASDADRAATADRLRQHYTEGRLDAQEYDERIEHCYAAKTVDELDDLFMDLPRATARGPNRTGASVSRLPATVAVRAGCGGRRRAHRRLDPDWHASLLAGVATLLHRLRAIWPLALRGP